jgi:hypothetical protein
MGAILAKGALYCPATPSALLETGPLARGATEAETAAHDAKAAELCRRRLAPLTGYDEDGYHRVGCPAARGKLRCPLRPASMALDHTRPEVSSPPEHPPICCSQRTVTVPASVNAKTAQKHDYPSPEHRRSARGAPPPSAPTPRSRTRPPTTSQEAGAGWSVSLRSRCSQPASSSPATCASPTPSMRGWPKTRGVPPRVSRPSGASAGAGVRVS